MSRCPSVVAEVVCRLKISSIDHYCYCRSVLFPEEGLCEPFWPRKLFDDCEYTGKTAVTGSSWTKGNPLVGIIWTMPREHRKKGKLPFGLPVHCPRGCTS